MIGRKHVLSLNVILQMKCETGGWKGECCVFVREGGGALRGNQERSGWKGRANWEILSEMTCCITFPKFINPPIRTYWPS